jgi:hypothetical protein
MKKLMGLLLFAIALFTTSCDVHEWPEPTTGARLNLHLVYDYTFTIWEHPYNERSLAEYENIMPEGIVQYVVRLFPLSENGEPTQEYSHEYVFTKPIEGGYDFSTSIDVAPGNYQIMVWSQLFAHDRAIPFYDYTYFHEVRLGNHEANNDYRDAFRGKENVTVEPSYMVQSPIDVEIAMQRPLAKFEFITTDLSEFITKEVYRNQISLRAFQDNAYKSLQDYTIRFHYVGYMPDAFSIFTDRPVDSSTGVIFESSINKLTETEASLGFDYVFTNGKESSVSIQIEVLDSKGEQISLTEPIKVPTKRSYHTIIKGSFLMSTTSGGISIDPEYEGDHNVILRDEEIDEELDGATIE